MISPNPQWSFRFLRWYCHPAYEEDVAGDLEELFQERQEYLSIHTARWLLFRDVLVLCRPEMIGLPHFTNFFSQIAMFRNYFITSFRTLCKSKLYTFINTLGLAIAMAVVMLIAVYVSYDLSFDEYPPNNGNIYRHTVELIDSEWNSAKTFPGFGPLLINKYPQVEDFTRIYETPEVGTVVTLFPNLTDKYVENASYYADANVFDFFYLPLAQGNPNHLLNDPNQVMLSTDLAEKYFGAQWASKDLLGHSLQLTNYGNKDTKLYTLTGIFTKKPNSHFKPDVIMSIQSLPKDRLDGLDHFNWVHAYTYLRLQPETNVDQFKIETDSLLHYTAWNQYWKFDGKLQKLSDIHHISRYSDEMEAGSDIRLNYFLIGVAIFIMLCAWVNYINMAVAKSLKRAKEVGVRKTLGAQRWNIIVQFLYEGFWLNLLSGIIAILLAVLALPLLNNEYLLHNDSWPLQLWINGYPQAAPFVILTFGLIFIGTLLSGIYPALMLSSFHPVRIFHGMPIRQMGSIPLRQSLLTFQFVISALLVIGIFAAATQLNYMLNKDLGFDKTQKLVISSAINDINTVDNYLQRAQGFKNELSHVKGVEDLTTASSVPGEILIGDLVLSKYETYPEGLSGTELIYNEGPTNAITVGANFFEFYNMELVSGRWFSPQAFMDTALANQHLLVNEKFASANGFDPPESVVGKIVYLQQHKTDGTNYREPKEIIGLVKNHHQFSVKEDFLPLAFVPEGATTGDHSDDKKIPFAGTMKYFSLNIQLGNTPQEQIPQLISEVNDLWTQYFPELAFEYFFLDNAFDNQYQSDIQFSKIFGWFGLLSIFISCLGLFGLSSYLIQQRTKEIGIRKVLGASLKSLFSLLSANYIKLVIISSIIAIPIAWWGIQQWLDNYAFRIEVQWWFFVLPLLSLLGIALLTISFKVVQTARANPVDSLKHE